MKVSKSSNHRKITGNYGEYLTLYLLSRYGFECAHVDHTGIDIIARHPHSSLRMGISVKSRSRNPGTEKTGIIINAKDFTLAKKACRAFGCELYFSIVVDRGKALNVFLLPEKRLKKIGRTKTGRAYWPMHQKAMLRYEKDPLIARCDMQSMISWGALDIKAMRNKP
jgi:hypothetical protein